MTASTTVQPTGISYIDSLLHGRKWTDPIITYSFPKSKNDYDYNNDNVDNFLRSFNEFEQQAAKNIFKEVSEFTNAKFVEVSANEPNVEIRFSYMSNGSTIVAEAGSPNDSSVSGDVWFNGTRYDDGNILYTLPGADYYRVLMHEMGHALGLKHSFEARPGFPAAQENERYLDFTVMDYYGAGRPVSSQFKKDEDYYPQTYSRGDIAALQALYGANFETNSQDTVYKVYADGSMTAKNGNDALITLSDGTNPLYRTLWDGNGIDTYDFSDLTHNQTIDLRPGEGSTILDDHLLILDSTTGRMSKNIYNAFQYNGDTRSLIENVKAGSGDDIITGNAANNYIEGNAGNDTIYGGDGDDTLSGGVGQDTFIFGAQFGLDTILDFTAGAGIGDVIKFTWTNFLDFQSVLNAAVQVGLNTVIRWDINNTITLKNVQLSSLHADDFSFMQFDKIIHGTEGGSTLYGGTGNDLIYGHGEFLATDRLYGGDGDDVIYGGAGFNVLDGGAGNDYLDTSMGNGVSHPGAGVDTVISGSSTDSVSYYYEREGVHASLLDGRGYAGSANGDTYFSIEELQGSNTGDDILIGDHNRNGLYGHGGNDYLEGGGGNDNLGGGSGNDVLNGGTGNDVLYGNSGNDTFIFDINFGLDKIMDFTAGAGIGDVIKFTWWGFRDFQSVISASKQVGSDTVITFDSNNTITLLNVQLSSLHEDDFSLFFNQTLHGTEMSDTLYGGSGNDLIYGYGGDDFIYGQDGDDMIYGGTGTNRISGGKGNDYLDSSAGIGIFDPGAGADIVIGGNTSSDNVTYEDTISPSKEGVHISLLDGRGYAGDAKGDTYVSIEDVSGSRYNDILIGNNDRNSLYGKDGDDTLSGEGGDDWLYGDNGNDTLSGGVGNDRLMGGYGDDRLEGGAGNDSLDGNDGNDVLNGGSGNDSLSGSNGNDILNGGIGNDSLAGGTGNDTFVFDKNFGLDNIWNFTAGAGVGDVIDFATNLFSDFQSVISAAKQVGANTVIQYDQDNTITLQNVQLISLHADDFSFHLSMV